MIPRLFESTATTFTNFGICPLADCIECMVTEERNGGYTLEMHYPRGGMWAKEISVDRIILAQPYDNAEHPQPFRIVTVTYDMNGDIQVDAEHISYELNSVIIGKNSQSPGTRYPSKFWEVENRYIKNSTNPFTFTTDADSDSAPVHEYGCEEATPLKTLLGGIDGSMIDLFGGELEWDRYSVKLWKSRGKDNGVKIAYTKNLTGLQYTVDLSEVVTGVVGFYKSGDIYVESALQTVANNLGSQHIVVVDLTQEFTETPTVAQLNLKAAAFAQERSQNPEISVDVEFVPLWQTLEYKEFYALEHVNLCDIVQIIYPPLNIALSAKVVKTVYNVLADRYENITISTVRKTLADTIFGLMER